MLSRTVDEFGLEHRCDVIVDAEMVARGLEAMPLEEVRVMFIENVGNLVCPAAFDFGETRRVVLLSATEGEDKPLPVA